MPTKRKPAGVEPPSDRGKGLFRTTLAGSGQTLNEAFLNLERAPRVDSVARHEGRNLYAARVDLPTEEGSGYWGFARIREDIYVVMGDFAYKDPRVELLTGDGLVQFYFKLSGDLTLQLARSEPVRLTQPSLLIYHQPPGVEVTEWMAPRAHERCVAINVRPQALRDMFGPAGNALPPQLEALMAHGVVREASYVQLPLSAEMFDLASKLVDSPYVGALGLVYIEALVMQLLCVVVGNFGRLAETPSEQYTHREVRCLHAARAIVMNQLAHPPTIRQVARAAGINETTLKRGFKALFGETLFEFSVRCRMQHALTLFREQRLSVAEVSEAVGYRHQTSFATAFRRHFGLRPKDARRSRRL